MIKNNTIFQQMSNAYKVKTVKTVQNFVWMLPKYALRKLH